MKTVSTLMIYNRTEAYRGWFRSHSNGSTDHTHLIVLNSTQLYHLLPASVRKKLYGLIKREWPMHYYDNRELHCTIFYRSASVSQVFIHLSNLTRFHSHQILSIVRSLISVTKSKTWIVIAWKHQFQNTQYCKPKTAQTTTLCQPLSIFKKRPPNQPSSYSTVL